MILNPEDPQAKEFSIDDKGQVMSDGLNLGFDHEQSKRLVRHWHDQFTKTRAALDVAVSAPCDCRSECTAPNPNSSPEYIITTVCEALAKIAELQKEKP